MVEHNPQGLLHWQFAVHPLCDDACICANERKGEGLEVWSGMSGRECCAGAAIDVDLQTKEQRQNLMEFYGGGFTLPCACDMCWFKLLTSLSIVFLDFLHCSRIALHPATTTASATDNCSNGYRFLLPSHTWCIPCTIYPQLDLAISRRDGSWSRSHLCYFWNCADCFLH